MRRAGAVVATQHLDADVAQRLDVVLHLEQTAAPRAAVDGARQRERDVAAGEAAELGAVGHGAESRGGGAGRERILVIDSSKVGTEAVYRLCAVEKCDLVITDDGIGAADLAKLRRLTSVLVAG